MQHVNNKRMSAEKRKQWNLLHKAFAHKPPIFFFFNRMIQKISRKIQKEPWKKRKIIGRVKSGLCKPQKRHDTALIEKPRKFQQIPSLKAQISAVDIPSQYKQSRAYRQPCKSKGSPSASCKGRHLLYPLMQNRHKKHTTANQCKDSEYHPIFRHEQNGNKGHGRSPGKNNAASFNRMFP